MEASAGRAERADRGGTSECVLPSVSRGCVPRSQPGARARSVGDGEERAWQTEASAGRAERADRGGKSECVLPSVSRGCCVPRSQTDATTALASGGGERGQRRRYQDRARSPQFEHGG